MRTLIAIKCPVMSRQRICLPAGLCQDRITVPRSDAPLTCSQLVLYSVEEKSAALPSLCRQGKSCQSIGRVAGPQPCRVEMLDPSWVGRRARPFWHLWEHRCVSAELGTGDLSREGCGWLYSTAVWIVTEPASIRAVPGFPSVSVNRDQHKTKGSHLGKISVATFIWGCRPFQPAV